MVLKVAVSLVKVAKVPGAAAMLLASVQLAWVSQAPLPAFQVALPLKTLAV